MGAVLLSGAESGVARAVGRMTNDRQVEETALGWFTRLRDDRATEADWLAFADWVAASPVHGAAYDELERLWVGLDELQPESQASGANDNGRPGRSIRRRGWLYPAVGVAAAALLAIGIWPMMSNPAKVYRAEDQPLSVRLDDGSKVELNRHTEMWVRHESGSRRVVIWDGEAAFDVAHDAARPFVVEADGREVRVLGTAFNVMSHDGDFSVEVERGVVAVTARSAAKPVRLTAGGRVRQAGNDAPQVDRVDPAAVATWQSGVLVYRAAPLDEVGRDLSRYFSKPVKVSASAKGLRFTGALRIADEKAMLDQLRDFMPVDVQSTSAEVRLTSRETG